ncbi:MAG TPA: dTDP-4-dehydrorhamnose reductase [Acidimicrobiia bacterium]|nr:dTDP-4-dehydrorhamnose reductase [Acidimicrobiia bacterium]
MSPPKPLLAQPLVLGSSGQLGTAFGFLVEGAIAADRTDLDLAQASIDSVRRLVASREPSAIINCAGYTAVDQAEEEEVPATAINATAVGILAEVAADAGIPFVTFSTDYVFDGEADRPYLESDGPNPISAYGRSKLAGERLALDANLDALVIRTSWLISGTHPNFVATMLRLAKEGRPARVVNDQHGRPTVARDLARATLTAIEAEVSGVLHLTNQGPPTTWFELAQASIRSAGLDPDFVTACTTAEYPTPATRPAYSVLGSERASQLDLVLPDWRDSLPGVVEELMSR